MAVNKTEEVEVLDMDELLGTKASVTIASTEEKKNSMFDREDVDITFLDNPPPEGGTDEEEAERIRLEEEAAAELLKTETPEEKEARLKEEEDTKAAKVIAEAGGDLGKIEEEAEALAEAEAGKNKGGRKGALIEAVGKMVAKGTLTLFDDQPDIETYTIENVEELIESNITAKVNETAQNAPLEVFKRLDPKLQDVVAYALNGGKDVISVLKTVTRSQEVAELSLENETDQERIVREHFRSIEYGDDETIEDEIASIIDRGELEKKATTFKPKLDAKQATILKKKMDEQELKVAQAAKASERYAETIFKVLDNPTLNGIPLSEKEQTMLYYGLSDNTQYQDRNGDATNALGHLIERYQFGDNADPSVLAEALWLMADPQGYRNKVLSLGKQRQDTRTVRNLKTAEGEKTTSSNKGDGAKAPAARKAPIRRKPGQSMFSR
jgi:hypothetical protein